MSCYIHIHLYTLFSAIFHPVVNGLFGIVNVFHDNSPSRGPRTFVIDPRCDRAWSVKLVSSTSILILALTHCTLNKNSVVVDGLVPHGLDLSKITYLYKL